MDWPVFLSDKSVSTGTHRFRAFMAVANTYGKPACFRMANGLDLTHKKFRKLEFYNIRREYTCGVLVNP